MLKFINRLIIRIRWRIKNQHNNTWPVSIFDISKVKVGEKTYGPLDVQDYGVKGEMLEIGKFVSIANNVQFILGGNHHMDTFTTYPLKKMIFNEVEAFSKGKIIIEDGAWIATSCIVLSGVTIGRESVVAAGAVVTKSVPPYAVVAGIPAKVVRMRFSQDIIAKLEQVDLSSIDVYNKEIVNLLYKKINSGQDVDDLVSKLLSISEGNKNE
ncbi:MAG: CatB-related O-acetyltransferase [Liquorilactobacillus sp.]|uniref:CatB-related O-acetyltransferase n=1 Tax=Liquorilactobacillus sp. TaxID=2767923 RepID=UPI0039ECB785